MFLTRNLRAPRKKGNLKYRETRHPLENALSTIRHGATTARMISALNLRAVLSARRRNLHLIRRAKTYCFSVYLPSEHGRCGDKTAVFPLHPTGKRKKLSRSLISLPQRFLRSFYTWRFGVIVVQKPNRPC